MRQIFLSNGEGVEIKATLGTQEQAKSMWTIRTKNWFSLYLQWIRLIKCVLSTITVVTGVTYTCNIVVPSQFQRACYDRNTRIHQIYIIS